MSDNKYREKLSVSRREAADRVMAFERALADGEPAQLTVNGETVALEGVEPGQASRGRVKSGLCAWLGYVCASLDTSTTSRSGSMPRRRSCSRCSSTRGATDPEI
jgi:hypothetical protein